MPHYSTLICSNQISRDDALQLLKLEPLYPDDELDVEKEFILSKLGFSEEEFETLLEISPKKSP